MRITRIVTASAMVAALTAACADSPAAPDAQVAGVTSTTLDAHDHNNGVRLSGDGVTGTATLNFIRGGNGQGNGRAPAWRTTVNLTGLADGTYTVWGVGGPEGQFQICEFSVEANGGRQGCSTDIGIPGFAALEVRDAGGAVVASGSREERSKPRA